jgi:integrase
MTHQWQDELQAKFGLAFTIIDRGYLAAVRRERGFAINPWSSRRRASLPRRRTVERAGIEAKLGFKAHPHMMRHACGYALANRGHDTRALQAYLGHKNIQHTVRYTELSPTRFKDFWR